MLESSCVSYGSKTTPHNLPVYCGVYLTVWKTKKSFFDLDDKSGVTIRLQMVKILLQLNGGGT